MTGTLVAAAIAGWAATFLLLTLVESSVVEDDAPSSLGARALAATAIMAIVVVVGMFLRP